MWAATACSHLFVEGSDSREAWQMTITDFGVSQFCGMQVFDDNDHNRYPIADINAALMPHAKPSGHRHEHFRSLVNQTHD